MPNPMAPPQIEVQRLDEDRDGKVDQFKLTVKVKTPKAIGDSVLQQASIIAAFDYNTKGTHHFRTEALAHSQVYLSSSEKVAAKGIKMTGSLKLRQTEALGMDTFEMVSRPKVTRNFFKLLEFQASNTLLDEYYRQGNAVHYDHSKVIDYGHPEYTREVKIEMVVKVPQRQEIRYVPGPLHVFKFAWVQYFFAFLFWYALLYKGLLAFLV